MVEFFKCLRGFWSMTTWKQRFSIRFHLSRPYFHATKGYRCMLDYTWKDFEYGDVTNWWTFVRVPAWIAKKWINGSIKD